MYLDLNIVKEVVNDISRFNLKRQEYIESSIMLLNKLIEDFSGLKSIIAANNEATSFLYNPLYDIPIQEPIHSKILAKLLDPYAEHGQGKLFLSTFLEQIGIKDPLTGSWRVTAELGRIDILLVRDHPLSVIIIENKSNNAQDQSNQLYRYWHQEIYKRKNELDYPGEYFQILYLTSVDDKFPADNSTQISENLRLLDDSLLPERMPIKYKAIRFNPNIIDWLTICTKQLHEDNNRLKEFLTLYIELWR